MMNKIKRHFMMLVMQVKTVSLILKALYHVFNNSDVQELPPLRGLLGRRMKKKPGFRRKTELWSESLGWSRVDKYLKIIPITVTHLH